MKEYYKRNYNATVERGLINLYTTEVDFIQKIYEEVAELFKSVLEGKLDEKELADVILVCFSMADYFNIDIESVIMEKVKFNEIRKDGLNKKSNFIE